MNTLLVIEVFQPYWSRLFSSIVELKRNELNAVNEAWKDLKFAELELGYAKDSQQAAQDYITALENVDRELRDAGLSRVGEWVAQLTVPSLDEAFRTAQNDWYLNGWVKSSPYVSARYTGQAVSLSVGHILVVGDEAYVVAQVGFEKLDKLPDLW